MIMIIQQLFEDYKRNCGHRKKRKKCNKSGGKLSREPLS
jgi:hypothetical protein